MAEYTEVSSAQATFKAGIGQDFMTIVRDNFINHQDRITAIENSIVLFDHFNARHFDIDNNFNFVSHSWPVGQFYGQVGNAERRDGRGAVWSFLSTQNDAGGTRNPAPPASSVARISEAGSGSWVTVQSNMRLRFDQITKPMRFIIRMKMDADGAFKIGMITGTGIASKSVDQTGVWLERVDASNWRFKVRDTGASSVTGSFARVANGTWFEIDIEFTDTPSDRVICRLDGVDKTAGGLTSNLPITADLGATMATFSSGTGTLFDFDRVLFRAAGIADAP